MNEKDQSNNPYNLCIFKGKEICESCSLKEKLDCHFDLKKLLRFFLTFTYFTGIGIIGLYINNLIGELIIFLIALGIFAIIFFEFWEIKILCSHCPFYAEKGKTLHCYGNYGSLKVWKYNPVPMSKSEKVQLIIGFILFFSIMNLPAFFLFMNSYWIWGMLPITGFILFIIVIGKYHCPYCFNFSCPFNRMPKDIVNEFLKRNPVMLKAWQGKGYKIEE
ncbi:MAG: hypothetical protein ACTSVV_02120 [Promethearchaeota archaeon]